MRKPDKVKLWIFIILRLSIITAGSLAVLEENWAYLTMSVLTLVVLSLPSIFERRFRIDIPDDFEIVLIIFMYAAIFLGELNEFYYRYWWWDKILHSFSGLMLGTMGFLIVRYLNDNTKMNLELSPVFVAVFSFLFAVSLGAVWEIYEYFMDKLFGLFMQRGSLDDTMTDLVLDTLGALIFAVLGYFQERGKIQLISRYLVKFDDDNKSQS